MVFEFITSYNVQIIQEPDKGRYDALNKGIVLVKTKYFMLIHGDDVVRFYNSTRFLLF